MPRPKATREQWTLDGHEIAVTNLAKVYWPGPNLAKRDLLEYYRQIAPVMLPYLRVHPLTLRVFPNGTAGFGYYLREQPASAPGWLRCVPYTLETREETVCEPLVEDAAGLVWYANRGAVEFHMWLSRESDLEHADWAVFDLDRGPDVPFEQVLRAALLVRVALDRLGITGYAKTSGGRGMHVFVPLVPERTFDEVRNWVRGVAEQVTAEHPDVVSVGSGSTHGGELVAIDYAQNSLGRNTAAPYTLRATPGATVSAPVTWQEVEAGVVAPDRFTLQTLHERLSKVGDPWAPAIDHPQRLSP